MSSRLRLLCRLASRDLRRHPIETLMVFTVIAVAATTLTVAFALASVTNDPYGKTRVATHGPDVIAEVFNGLPNPGGQPHGSHHSAKPGGGPSGLRATISALIGASGVSAHSGPYPALYGTIDADRRRAAVVVEGRDQRPAAVDQPQLTAGSWVKPGGVVLERGFADALRVHIGETVDVEGDSLRVVGIAVTAGVPAYPSSLCHLACLTNVPANMGLVWVSRALATRLASRRRASAYLINLRLENPSAAASFVALHSGTSSGSAVAILYPWQSIRDADAELIKVEQLALQFGGWLLELLALAGLAVLVGRRMTEQKRRVGLLKAAGATPGVVGGTLVIEHLAVGTSAAFVGLIAGRSLAPLIASPGAGLLGTAGAPSLSATAILMVAVVAVAVAAGSALIPAIQAVRTSTVAALVDAPRIPRRRPLLVSVSSRLPASLLIGVRQLARRPRRALLNSASVTVTVSGLVAILASAAATHAGGSDAVSNLKTQRLDQLTLVITAMLIMLAALNTTFIAWATATDGRFGSALQRALGATARQVTIGLSVAALLPTLPAALAGVPIGIEVYRQLDPGQSATPPLWQLLAVVLVSLIAVGILTAVPSRSAAQPPVAKVLQGD